MQRTSRTLLVLMISYLATVIILIYGMIATAKMNYEMADFMGQVFTKLIFCVFKGALFVNLIQGKQYFELKLSTQVLA